MKLEHLDYFVKVAQCGSINKAAAQLYISQPHLSRIIKDIEDEAGTRLLARRSQGVMLTEDGETFLNRALNVLNGIKELGEFATRKKCIGRTLHISMTKYSHIMESFLDVCRARQGGGSFSYRLNEGTAIDVVGDVAEGRADVGVLHFESRRARELQRDMEERGLDYCPIAVAEPRIILSQNHPLFQRGTPITLEALAGYGFARYTGKYEDFTYEIQVDGEMVNLNRSPQIVYLEGRASLLHLIATSDFYTIGIHSFEQQSIYHIESVPIPGIEEHLQFAYILPRNDSPTDEVMEFLYHLRRRFQIFEDPGGEHSHGMEGWPVLMR